MASIRLTQTDSAACCTQVWRALSPLVRRKSATRLGWTHLSRPLRPSLKRPKGAALPQSRGQSWQSETPWRKIVGGVRFRSDLMRNHLERVVAGHPRTFGLTVIQRAEGRSDSAGDADRIQVAAANHIADRQRFYQSSGFQDRLKRPYYHFTRRPTCPATE